MTAVDPKRKLMTLRAHRAEWPTGRNLNLQCSPIKSGPQPIVTAQGRVRGRMPIVLQLSAIGMSHLGNPGSVNFLLFGQAVNTVGSTTFEYAQTNCQLYGQLQALGYGAGDFHTVRVAYETAQRLFSAQFRASGRPFVAHLTGTASILASHGCRPAVVSAGLLHAAYAQGDFGTGAPGLSPSKRRYLADAVGSEIETLVAYYARETLTSAAHRCGVDQDGERSDVHHDLVLMYLANALEEALAGNFTYSGAAKQRDILARLPAFIDWAKKLDLPALGDELRAAYDTASTGQGAAPWIDHSRSYILAPRSYRIRFWPGVNGAVRRLTRRLRVALRQPLKDLAVGAPKTNSAQNSRGKVNHE